MSAEVVGKIVFVTGGASGIGRAAAEAFSVGGAEHVVVADLDREGAEETVGRLVGSGSAVALASSRYFANSSRPETPRSWTGIARARSSAG